MENSPLTREKSPLSRENSPLTRVNNSSIKLSELTKIYRPQNVKTVQLNYVILRLCAESQVTRKEVFFPGATPDGNSLRDQESLVLFKAVSQNHNVNNKDGGGFGNLVGETLARKIKIFST